MVHQYQAVTSTILQGTVPSSNYNYPNSDVSATVTTTETTSNSSGAAAAAKLSCPRCDSTNTKFCYYNNYNLTQPRHFCKSCRRYWTKGGTLRNIPIGGGCRKHKPPQLISTAAKFRNTALETGLEQQHPGVFSQNRPQNPSPTAGWLPFPGTGDVMVYVSPSGSTNYCGGPVPVVRGIEERPYEWRLRSLISDYGSDYHLAGQIRAAAGGGEFGFWDHSNNVVPAFTFTDLLNN